MSKIKFDLFRLSLRDRSQKGLFEGGEPTRESYIRALFSQNVSFRHHGTDFQYIFSPDDSSDEFVVGKIGRQIFSLENLPPETGYAEFIHSTWKAALVVVDPRSFGDGQKIAIQRHRDVGKALALAPRLVSALEEKMDEKHFLSGIHPLASEQAFWDFVERNRGKITKISFELEVPNMFGGDDEYTREMREFRDNENAKKVKIEVSNPDGILADSERVQYTAHKALEQGTGSITAKAMGKNNRFSSKRSNKTSEIELEEKGADARPLMSLAASLANRILGRE